MRYEDILCDANILYKAYLASVKNSKWKDSSQKVMLNFLRYIFKLQDELSNRTLRNGKAETFPLHERGKIRPISSLTVEDKIIRHALCDDVFMPLVRNKIIYDNGASVRGRGISFSRKRFEIHLKRYFKLYGNSGYILFGDFSKFYDNIIHDVAKRELNKLTGEDEFVKWLLDIMFDAFVMDVSYMSDSEFEEASEGVFDKLKHRERSEGIKPTGERLLYKSVNIGDQLSQILGIYYPYRIDNYVKYVRGQKFYGRHNDDWYIMSPSKELLHDIYDGIQETASELGIHLNKKKTRIVRIDSSYRFLQIKYSLTSTGKIIKQINPKRVTAMRRKLKKLAVKVKDGRLPYIGVENTFKSWMCANYKTMSRRQRENMITLFEDLFDKKIEVIQKKMIFKEKE